MSRVVKNVIVWVLVLAVILCIIAGFTFGLSSVSGVASAKSDSNSSNYVNGGVVRDNILKYSTPDSLSENLRINYSIDGIDDIPFGDANFDDYLYGTDVANITIGDDGIWNITSTDGSANFYYLKNIPSADISNTAFTFTIALHLDTVSSGDYDYGLSYVTKNPYGNTLYNPASYFNLSNYQVNDVVILSIDASFPADHYLTTDFYAFSFTIADGASPLWLKVERYSLNDEAGFTGYVEYNKNYNDGYDSGYDAGYNAGVTDGTQSGYDKGYADGYDEGYNNGLADGLVSANQIFNCSAFNIKWDSVNEYAYPSNETVSANLYQNIPFTEMPVGVCVPLSKIAPDDYGGGYLPIDLLPHTEGSSNNPADSIYALRFRTLLDVGQWLLDNPNDYLVSWTITGESDPACIVFSDLSNLPTFMSGAAANYQLGYDEGYDDGYVFGDDAGYNRGYGLGFNDGQADASSGNYTFLALIGSVLDAPISAFKGLLDFDLLGVNMSSFVLAIMSLCVIIVIIRVVLR